MTFTVDKGVLVICGPTASGKSGLAMQLAESLMASDSVGVELISADSAQVYRGMDIGTAKPTDDEQRQVPHHLIDIRDPWHPFSAADFREQVLSLVPEIHSRGALPLIVGGTMLYLKALKEGLAVLPEAEPQLREQILKEAEQQGWHTLHDELAEVDPVAAARIRPTDTQRLQRAIEVFRLTGEPLTRLQQQSGEPCPFPLLELAIVPPDRAVLHEKIAARFEDMIRSGFVEEVEALRNNPNVNKELPAIKAVGYRQCWSYLDGEVDRETMVQQAIAATRQLAKRQFTWIRSWQDLHRLEAPDLAGALKILRTATIFRASPG